MALSDRYISFDAAVKELLLGIIQNRVETK